MDKIFLRLQYTVHYRATQSLQLSIESSNDYAALFLLEGKLLCRIGEEDTVLEGPRGALLIAPGAAAQISGERAEHIMLTLAPSFVLDCATRLRLIRAGSLIDFRSTFIELDYKLERAARDLADELKHEEAGQEIIVTALVEQLIVHLLRRYSHARRADEIELSRVGLIDRRIRRAVELMHARLAEDLPLEEIAAAAYLSPFHFARLFKKATGTSPHAYLAGLRVARARILLAETDMSVTEVGTRVGYSSPSHFTKAFRQATGLSPRAFRNALIRG